MRREKIVFFPKYVSKAPSSRYRLYNYIDYYVNSGYSVEIYPLLGDWWLDSVWKHRSKLRILHLVFFSYIKRVCILWRCKRDVIIHIQAEALPYIPFFIERLLLWKKNYIVEYDDAIFHHYDLNKNVFIRFFLKNKISSLIKKSSHTIVGSEYLMDYAIKRTCQVTKIPTSIDKDKYKNVVPICNKKFVIGWIGSPTTSYNILSLLPVFRELLHITPYELHLVGFDQTLETKLCGIPYKIKKWDELTELDSISNFTVGIMPLLNTPFNNGKCAFKLVQYMAIGIPTISSPLKSNIDIDMKNGNLFASTSEEWLCAFKNVLENREYFQEIGKRNKTTALSYYTIQSNYPKYIEIYQKLGL